MVAEVLEPIKIKERIYTLAEYFELEEKAVYKSEFRNGKNFQIDGNTLRHNRIKRNICGLLFFLYKAQSNINFQWELFDSDQRVYIPDYDNCVYPDACIVIGKPQKKDEKGQAILNPALVVEVTSNSTGKYDRPRTEASVSGGKSKNTNPYPLFKNMF